LECTTDEFYILKNLFPTKRQWKAWSLPSKLTVIGTFVGLLSFTFYLIEKSYPYLRNFSAFNNTGDVTLVVEFENKNSHDVQIYGRGETFFWFPGGGKYRNYSFEIVDIGRVMNSTNISVPKKSKIQVVIKLLPSAVARNYLEQGHMSVSLVFNSEDGASYFSPTFGFSETNIANGYIPITVG